MSEETLLPWTNRAPGEALLPWEIFEVEVPRHLSFQSCYVTGLTCKRLQAKWRSWVRGLPLFVAQPCDNTRLILFPNLNNLNLENNHLVTSDSLTLLTNLTSLKLNSRLHVLPEKLTVFGELRDFNLNRELELNPQFTPTKEQALVHTFKLLTALEILCQEGGLSEAFTTESAFLSLIELSEVLMTLPQLVSLDLGCNKTNLHDILIRLTKLTSLNLGDNECVSDDTICSLTNLTSLGLGYNLKVTDQGFTSLVKLRHLDLGVLPERFSESALETLKLRDIELI